MNANSTDTLPQQKGAGQLARLERHFARTNRQTIAQRAAILQEFGYVAPAIAEICCGDCRRQQAIYRQTLQTTRYCGLDLSPDIVAFNKANGVDCRLGDALDPAAMRDFLSFDVLFFGPPLSAACDGHTGLPFREVVPGFDPFARLLLQELGYPGLLVCILPNSANMGDIRWLYTQAQSYRPEVGLRLIHYSYASLTGADEPTERRLKYIELWLRAGWPNAWEVRES